MQHEPTNSGTEPLTGRIMVMVADQNDRMSKIIARITELSMRVIHESPPLREGKTGEGVKPLGNINVIGEGLARSRNLLSEIEERLLILEKL